VNVNDLVLVQGIRDTRKTLEAWSRRPWMVVGGWVRWSIAIVSLLLFSIFVVAKLSAPDLTRFSVLGVHRDGTPRDVAIVLYRNSLVLALHAMACVAGFIAGSSLPISAAHRDGVWRWIHEKAGPLAIGFVVFATTFSLATQAYVLGGNASTISAQLEISPATLLMAYLPHAMLELVAVFLPLAAWLIASRRGNWEELLAATFVTVGIAVPVLVVAASIEVYISPLLLGLVIP
jgi:Stage II sporulation protein M